MPVPDNHVYELPEDFTLLHAVLLAGASKIGLELTQEIYLVPAHRDNFAAHNRLVDIIADEPLPWTITEVELRLLAGNIKAAIDLTWEATGEPPPYEALKGIQESMQILCDMQDAAMVEDPPSGVDPITEHEVRVAVNGLDREWDAFSA